MSENLSFNELERFAENFRTRALTNFADIKSPVDWKCMKELGGSQKSLIVLENGDVLTSDPISPDLYHCVQYLRSCQKQDIKIFPTTRAIIHRLNEDSIDENSKGTDSHQSSVGEKELVGLISMAIDYGSSDIHLCISQQVCLVQFRIDGVIKSILEWPPEEGLRLHNVAYNFVAKDKVDNFNISVAQDISFTISLGDRGNVRIRSSNVPTHNGGCNIVYRVLSIDQKGITAIESLGYTEGQLRILKLARGFGSGLVLFCGETGSGKTTTLASILAAMDPRLKSYSIEDPVEKLINNIIQIPVDVRDKSRSFAFYLRAILRQDPDVIMLGEIRDSETAKVAIQSALTGHLLFSTLHTRFATDAITRLANLGVDPIILGTPNLVRLIVAQELHPILCHTCRRYLTSEEQEKMRLIYNCDTSKMMTCPTTDGSHDCSDCGGSGVARRKVFAEFLQLDHHAYRFIRNSDLQGWFKYLLEHNFISVRTRVQNAIASGEIDALNIKSLDPPVQEEFFYED